ncbi:MAG: hypothetical protein L0H41_03425 [Microlunatus sp.]|nr:hypothetical protein [Microlunatus sp.]MDN5803091.1 hypothetical protein [Microlunatus sp.]
MATGFPMVGWGTAWILGLGALDLLDGLMRILVAALAWVIGMLLSWLPMRAMIRTGSETRMRWAWVVVLVASPFLVAAARPASFSHGVLLVGALWGLAMCLYAIATNDPILAVVAGFGIVMAGALAVLDIPSRLLWFGVSAGLPLLALGIHRVCRGGSRV